MIFKKFIGAGLAAVILAAGTVGVVPENSFCITASAETEVKINYRITYNSDDVVLTLIPSAEGNKLYYSTDGTKPNKESKIYRRPLRYDEDTKVRVVEYDKNGKVLAYATINVELRCIPVDITIVDISDGKASISLSTGTDDAVIYYTVDGSKPKKSSKKYTGEFQADADAVICAYAVKSGYKSSKVTELDLKDLVVDVKYDNGMKYIFNAVNKERKKRGLSELTLDPVLTAAATKRAKEISKNYEIEHNRPNGNRWNTVLAEYDYDARTAAENIGRNTYDYKEALKRIVSGWMNSEAHRNNILSEKVTDIGIGWVKKGDYYYFVQILGKRK